MVVYGGLIDRGGVGMGKVFLLVILQALYQGLACIILVGVNIDRQLRVQGVECVLTLSANCFNETHTDNCCKDV